MAKNDEQLKKRAPADRKEADRLAEQCLI